MKINSIRDIAATIRGRRLDLSLSQAELARTASVSREWVSEFESGKPTAEIGLVIRVIEALGLRIDLTEYEEVPDPSAIDLDSVLKEYREK
ncbi:MAG: helix-turn-helix transcriptional regulator [Acidimicrobiales bacterium]|nr:helix-turn-helix transcriptional regulator [Acidimicrobiales bacterium]